MDDLPDLEHMTLWEQVGSTMRRLGVVPQSLVAATRLYLADLVHAGRNSDPVRVVAVDEAEHQKWCIPPGARGRSLPVSEDMLFPSAMSASHHLGFSHNEVAQRLSRARLKQAAEAQQKFGPGKQIRLRPSATVRGVTLQYEKDVPE